MDAYILSAVRTPIGKFLGGLAAVPAPRLGAVVAAEAVRRAGVRADQIDEVIVGNVLQAGLGQNPARQVALFAGLPDTVPAFTVNKVCGSGLKAVMLAAQAVRAGDADLVLAGGIESMSNAPHLLPGARGGLRFGDGRLVDSLSHDGLWCAFEDWPMGDAAEHTAATHGVSRDDQDAFAAESHRRAADAWQAGAFDDEVVPVPVGPAGQERLVDRDEGVRPDSTPATLARLKPAFREGGSVTAGNAAQLSDGASALVVASGRFLGGSGLTPLARVRSYAASGTAPREMFLAPVAATRAAVEKAGLGLDAVDLIELNEAFASQMLACTRELGLDDGRVNVHGGGIALGHPIGASGARVLTTLVHALKRNRKPVGVASLCLGGGNAVAMVVESTR